MRGARDGGGGVQGVEEWAQGMRARGDCLIRRTSNAGLGWTGLWRWSACQRAARPPAVLPEPPLAGGGRGGKRPGAWDLWWWAEGGEVCVPEGWVWWRGGAPTPPRAPPTPSHPHQNAGPVLTLCGTEIFVF